MVNMDLTQAATAVLLFLIGVVSKPLSELANYGVLAVVKTKERRLDAAVAQADAAAQVCLEHLATLNDEIPKRTNLSRLSSSSDDGRVAADLSAKEERIDSALAALEGAAFLLPPDTRKIFTQIIEILRAADDLSDPHSPYSHYHSVYRITRESVDYARLVLGAQLRRESLPLVPLVVREYQLALVDRMEFYDEMYAEDIAREQRTAEAWRSAHGL